MELRLSVCFFGLALMAGCSPQSASQSLAAGSAGENPWHLSREPMKSCQESERKQDARGLESQETQATEDRGSRMLGQGQKGVVFPKAKAYLQAMFRYIVEADSRQPMPMFRGHFAPDTFCLSVQPSERANAFMVPATGHMVFTLPMLLLYDEVRHWQTLVHELAHALLGHQHLFNPTTFPVPKEAEIRIIHLRQEFASLDSKSREAFARLHGEMPKTLKQYFAELSRNATGQDHLPFV